MKKLIFLFSLLLLVSAASVFGQWKIESGIVTLQQSTDKVGIGIVPASKLHSFSTTAIPAFGAQVSSYATPHYSFYSPSGLRVFNFWAEGSKFFMGTNKDTNSGCYLYLKMGSTPWWKFKGNIGAAIGYFSKVSVATVIQLRAMGSAPGDTTTGQVYLNSSDNRLYYRANSTWNKILTPADTLAIASRARASLLPADTTSIGTRLRAALKPADTTSIGARLRALEAAHDE